MSYAGEVIQGLHPDAQAMFAATSAYQRGIAPEAAERLRAGELSGANDPEARWLGAKILDNYADGRLTEDGFENVPLSVGFGQGVLPDSVRAFTSFRVPVEGSPNYFGMRPANLENQVNYLALLAINGVSAEDIVACNTAGTKEHVAVVSHDRDEPGGLTVVGDRLLPAEGQGDSKVADAVIMTDPALHKGIAGAHADIPLVVGTAGEALFMANGGWQNLLAGVDGELANKLQELGLQGPVAMAVGPGARTGFGVRLTRLEGMSPHHAELFVDEDINTDPEKGDLDLAGWAEQAFSEAIPDARIASMGLCTVAGADYLHSSRAQRTAKTEPGYPAGGDRGMAIIVPRDI